MDDHDPQTLGKNIARLRRRKHWTQRQLADLLHTDHSMVTRWEKGKAVPRLATLERLAEVFEVSTDELSGQVVPAASMPALQDPELSSLLHQIPTLDQRDREALKAVLEAMLTRSKLREMVSPTFQKAAS